MEGQAGSWCSAVPAWFARDICQCPQSFVTKVVIFCLPAVVNYSALPPLAFLFGSTSEVLCLLLCVLSAWLGSSVVKRVKCLLIAVNTLFAVENNAHLISLYLTSQLVPYHGACHVLDRDRQQYTHHCRLWTENQYELSAHNMQTESVCALEVTVHSSIKVLEK